MISANLSTRNLFCLTSFSWKIDGHPHERAAEAILVRRVEIEIDVAVGIEAAVHAAAGFHRAEIVVAHRAFPGSAPFRRSGRGERTFDRSGTGLDLANIASADETVR